MAVAAPKKSVKQELDELRAAQAKIIPDSSGQQLAPNTPDPAAVLGGAPTARKGENSMGSRGYSILKLVKARIAAENGDQSAWDDAKVERDVNLKLKANYGNNVAGAAMENGFLAPFSSDFIPEDMPNAKGFRQEIKQLLYAGIDGVDPDEMARVGGEWAMKHAGTPGPERGLSPFSDFRSKVAAAQSWLDVTLGGALVGPPAFGEPIELWRNRDALVRAGATVAPLPSSGRFVAPRQTNASTAYHVGEGTAGTGTNVLTGQITWTAKKLMALLVYNREILQFGGAAAEMLFRMDLTRSLVLGADRAMLEGGGGDTIPLGLVNTPNIATVTPKTVVSGNTGAILAAEDVYLFNSVVEENNIPDDAGCAFVMRPKMYYALLRRRLDAVSASDAAGAFTYLPFRRLDDAVNTKNINGQRVITTTQVSNTRLAGTNAANTNSLYGYWPDYLILMAPMLEFVIATQGNPTGLGDLFKQDQFCLKSIMYYDGAARHPGGFALCDSLQLV